MECVNHRDNAIKLDQFLENTLAQCLCDRSRVGEAGCFHDNLVKFNCPGTFLIIGYSDQLLRYKGILNFRGRDERVVFQGIHSLFEARTDREWRKDEVRTTRLVFIGRDLPEDEIREGIQGCIAAID